VYWVRINGQTQTGQPERFRPVTAADVVFTVRRACLSQTGALYAATLFIIEGCRDAYSVDPSQRDMTVLAEAIDVRVLNDVAVEFKLVADSAAFPTILSTPILYPLPQEVVASAGAGWTSLNGPWAVYARSASPIGENYTDRQPVQPLGAQAISTSSTSASGLTSSAPSAMGQ
jgi:ABC-type oligopeptide transport system substrate-binding subunit